MLARPQLHRKEAVRWCRKLDARICETEWRQGYDSESYSMTSCIIQVPVALTQAEEGWRIFYSCDSPAQSVPPEFGFIYLVTVFFPKYPAVYLNVVFHFVVVAQRGVYLPDILLD